MDDNCTYQMELRGQLDENELNANSPFQMRVERSDAASTLVSVSTDQSGIIGLIRTLHGRGFVLLSVNRER